MTDENMELFEELTHDRMEEVMRLDADNEAGKIAFNEVATLLRIGNETRELDAKIEHDKRTDELKRIELEIKIELDRRSAALREEEFHSREEVAAREAELRKLELEAAARETELKLAQERRMFWLKVFEIGSAVVLGAFVMPKIKLKNNIELAQTFAAIEKEDYFNGTPYKSLSKGVFRFD